MNGTEKRVLPSLGGSAGTHPEPDLPPGWQPRRRGAFDNGLGLNKEVTA